MGWTFFYQHRYAEAIVWYRKAIELDPSFVLAHNELGQSAYLSGREVEAIESWLRARALAGAPSQALDETRQAFRVAGTRGFWAKELERATSRPGSTPARPWRLARIYSELGDDDRTFASLERAYEERDSLMVFLKVNPIFDRLHADPRFDDLVRRIELGGPETAR